MNKNKKNIELKIYELLGIKTFRKMAFKLAYIFLIPFTLKKSEKERKELLQNVPSNYVMDRGHGLEDLRKFKKQLWFNTGIHAWALSRCIPTFLRVIAGTTTITSTISNLISITINIYCIMLQRYNYIRINKVIKKGIPYENKKKDTIKNELKEIDASLKEHNYKIINKRNKEKTITFDELLQNATLEQLKKYRTYLKTFQTYSEYVITCKESKDKQIDIKVPLENNKKLKLELKLENNPNKMY